MCPRFAWTKLRPGDLVWTVMVEGTKLYYDNEAGANEKAKETCGFAGHLQPCLCLAVDEDVVMVLAPDGHYGWSHRVWWEVAGIDKQEYELIGGPDDEEEEEVA
jgi:hypothetical protein